MSFLPGTPMAVHATAMAGRSLRFDAAEKRRVRAGCSRCPGRRFIGRAMRDGDVFAA